MEERKKKKRERPLTFVGTAWVNMINTVTSQMRMAIWTRRALHANTHGTATALRFNFHVSETRNDSLRKNERTFWAHTS